MADNGVVQRDFFISRAGENADTAIQIAEILRAAGYTTFIQDQDFGNADFMARMADGFAMVDRGARVIALLSPYYQKKPHCMKEAHYPLTDDPNNKRERLIVLRIADCTPEGHLRGIPYVDLVPLLLNADGFARAVRGAIAPHGQAEVVRTPGAQILHPEIRPVLGFTGREVELEAVEAALWRKGGKAALTATAAAVKGLGGVGKSVLAQEYGWRNRGRYQGVWWIRAEKSETLLDDLVELGARFIPGLKEVPDRAQAAHAALDCIAQMKAEKPWLLVYDNVEQPGDIAKMTPAEGAHVLITTRWQARIGGVQSISVDVFPPDVAVEYLRETAPNSDPHEAAELARDLGYLPLALSHARAYCAEADPAMSYKAYRASFAELIRVAPLDSDYPRAVFATFDLAVARAAERSPEAETLIGIFAFLAPYNIPLDLIPEKLMTEVVRSRAVAALGALSLITPAMLEDGSAGVSLHRLVQAVMRGRLRGNGAFAAVATQATALVAEGFPAPESPHDTQPWPQCARLASHVTAVIEHAPRKGGEASRTVNLLQNSATYLYGRADYAGAERNIRLALAIDETTFGLDHPSVAIRLNNLALLLNATNRLGEAEPLMRRALAISEKSFGPDHPGVAIRLNNLAMLLEATNRLGEAEPLIRRALAISEKSFGPDHPSVAIRLNNLALLLKATNRLGEAEPLMRRALDINETSFGPEHPNVARSLNNLAQLLKDTNRLGEAEPLMRRVVSIFEQSLGPDHPSVATSLNNLAVLLKSTNRFGEAEPLMRRALAIDETSFGLDHPSVATSLNNLATLLKSTNRLGEAEPLMRRALAIFEASLVPDHPNTRHARGNLDALEAQLHGET